jgi:hypothetical protein
MQALKQHKKVYDPHDRSYLAFRVTPALSDLLHVIPCVAGPEAVGCWRRELELIGPLRPTRRSRMARLDQLFERAETKEAAN